MGWKKKELMEAAAERSIKVYPASIYYKEGTSPKSTVLLGFATLLEEEIEEAIQLLYTAWFTRK